MSDVRWSIFVLSLYGAACADVSSARRGVVVDTVGGVERVTTVGPGVWRDSQGWRVGPEPVRIGDEGGGASSVFGRITGLAVSGELIAVADGEANEIRLYDRSGRFLRGFGRSGEGPGEFGYLDGLVWAPDGTLLARDARLLRLTRFAREGEVLQVGRLERSLFNFGDGRRLWVTDDGTIHDWVSTASGPTFDTTAIIRYEPDGAIRDTLRLGGVERGSLDVFEGERLSARLALPFSPRSAEAVSPSGRVAWGSGEDWSFVVLNADGTPLQVVRREAPVLGVTDAERRAVREALKSQAEALVPGARLGDFHLPDTKPAYSLIVADADEHWWVGGEAGWPPPEGPSRWTVFAPDGRYLGEIQLPEPIRVIQVGTDFVAGVARGDLDVESAVVYQLVRTR